MEFVFSFVCLFVLFLSEEMSPELHLNMETVSFHTGQLRSIKMFKKKEKKTQGEMSRG